MSELIINLDTATPVVLEAAISLCQCLLHDCHLRAQLSQSIGDAATSGTGAVKVWLDVAEDSKIRGATHTHVWNEEALHIQQEHIDSLAVHMESKQAGSPVGTVTTFTPPGLPAEFTLVNQPPVVIPPGLGAIGGTLPGNVVVELDSAGLPWDNRIHSSNKTKLANGTWRPKKGVDASVQTKVVKQIANEVTHVPPAPPAGTGMTWEILLQRIVAATQSQRINVVEFNQWLLDRNVQGGVAMLSLRNDLWNDVITAFGV